MTLRSLSYGNYGIFLIMGHAGFLSINRSDGIPYIFLLRIEATGFPTFKLLLYSATKISDPRPASEEATVGFRVSGSRLGCSDFRGYSTWRPF